MRAIIHLDLDAFYAQVEQVRLKLPKSTPLICIQWTGILAVSYSARSFGITRKDTIQEAMAKCPELKAVHVPVIRNGGDPEYIQDPDKRDCKSSLITYRQASALIMKIIAANTKKFQKASVDEVFIDVGDEAMEMNDVEIEDLQDTFMVDENGSRVISLVDPTEQDKLLLKAAKISKDLREKIFDELGYTCSTGGKLGAKVTHEFQISKCKQLWSFTAIQISQRLGIDITQADWIYGIVRGECDEAVREGDGVSKSMLSCKNFNSGLTDLNLIETWILNLSNELYMRLEDEHRWPRTLTLILRINASRLTKQTSMMHRDECKSPEDLSNLVKKVLYERDMVRDKKVFFVGLSLSRFENLGNTKSIGFFFAKDQTDKELLEIVDQNGNNLYYKCLDCGKVMERKERGAHEDFHFAKMLNFETNSVKNQQSTLTLGKDPIVDDADVVHDLDEAGDYVDVVKQDSIKDMLEAVDQDGINLYHKCLECGEILEQRHRLEHADYHFAFRISNELKGDSGRVIGKSIEKTASNSKSKVSKKSKSKGKGGPNIKSFFKKL